MRQPDLVCRPGVIECLEDRDISWHETKSLDTHHGKNSNGLKLERQAVVGKT